VLAALMGKDHPDYKARHSRWAKRLLKDKVQVFDCGNPGGICRQA